MTRPRRRSGSISGNPGLDVDLADLVLLALVHDDRDAIAARRLVELHIVRDDTEIGIAILEIEAAKQLEIRRDAVRIINVRVLQERQEIALRRGHLIAKPAR